VHYPHLRVVTRIAKKCTIANNKAATPFMRLGARVHISTPGQRPATGEVIDIKSPSEMPDVEGAPPADVVRAILREAGVVKVVLIRVNNQYAFWALKTRSGDFFDLRRQKLRIKVIVQ